MDFGAAFLPQNQDPTLAPSASWRERQRRQRSCGRTVDQQHQSEHDGVLRHVPLHPDVVQPPVPGGFSFGVNYTLGLSWTGNTGLQQRLQHAPDGTISRPCRSGGVRGAEQEPRTSSGTWPRSNGVWDLPDLATTGSGAAKKTVGYILNDWQLSGVLTAQLRPPVRPELQLQEQRREPEPHRLAGLRRPDHLHGRSGLRLLGQPVRAVQRGGGDRSDVRQPRASSRAATSWRLRRTRRLTSRSLRNDPGGRQPSAPVPPRRVQRVQRRRHQRAEHDASPTTTRSDRVVQNPQYHADGSLNPARLTPRNAGFGAATGAQNMRNLQAQIRFQF